MLLFNDIRFKYLDIRQSIYFLHEKTLNVLTVCIADRNGKSISMPIYLDKHAAALAQFLTTKNYLLTITLQPISSVTFQIFMARLPDNALLLPAEVCFANALIAALLCRVEYIPFLPILPSLFLFLSLLIFLSVLLSVLLPHPVRLLSQAQWYATSL